MQKLDCSEDTIFQSIIEYSPCSASIRSSPCKNHMWCMFVTAMLFVVVKESRCYKGFTVFNYDGHMEAAADGA